MGNILTDVHQRYLLQFGRYALSPLSVTSAGLLLEYIDDFSKADHPKSPFIVNFPNKKDACIPICSSLLINFFFRDYVYQNTELTGCSDLKPGDTIGIFDTVARIKHISEEKIELIFAQELAYALPKAHFKYITKPRKNKLSNYSSFKENKKALFSNRNAISQILEPNAADVVNPSAFSSTLLLVTGRGSLGRIRESFEDTTLYGEPLSKILLDGANFIIRKDLDYYKNIFDRDIDETTTRYKSLFLALYSRLQGNTALDFTLLPQVHVKIVNNDFLDQAYVDLYDELLESVDETDAAYKMLFHLKENYPGVKEPISPYLKAVVVYDIYILELYKDTVNGFLGAGIPVICLCDRLFESRDSLEFYAHWFEKNSDNLRINWNKAKISYLEGINTSGGDAFIDQSFWDMSVAYAIQKINFEVFDDEGIEKPINELNTKISTMDGHEILKEALWKYLYPITYMLKNTPGVCKPLDQLLTLFEVTVNNHVADDLLQQHIQQVVNLLKVARINHKHLKKGSKVFEQTLTSVANIKCFIPFSDNERRGSKAPQPTWGQITFTGFPYQEWHYRYLIRAISEECIPEVNILAWPEEYALTYRYVRQRMAAAYFTDNLQSTFPFPKELLLTQRADFDKELDACLHRDQSFFEQPVSEPNAFFENNFNLQHQRYVVGAARSDEEFTVRCNIIYFENQEFLYLPHHSKILAEQFSGASEKRFGRCEFDDLYEGCMLFQYHVSRSDMRDLSRSLDAVIKAFQVLELWRTLLQGLYKASGNNLTNLEKTLLGVKAKWGLKGNPSRQNIQRWLFQEDIISPDEENLEIILQAAECTDVTGTLKKNQDAAKIIKGFMISMASQIQKEIVRYINCRGNDLLGLECSIYNKPIRIEARKIIALERTDVLIKYTDARKILK